MLPATKGKDETRESDADCEEGDNSDDENESDIDRFENASVIEPCKQCLARFLEEIKEPDLSQRFLLGKELDSMEPKTMRELFQHWKYHATNQNLIVHANLALLRHAWRKRRGRAGIPSRVCFSVEQRIYAQPEHLSSWLSPFPPGDTPRHLLRPRHNGARGLDASFTYFMRAAALAGYTVAHYCRDTIWLSLIHPSAYLNGVTPPEPSRK